MAKFTIGSTVLTARGEHVIVKSYAELRSGKQGRPATVAIVDRGDKTLVIPLRELIAA